MKSILDIDLAKYRTFVYSSFTSDFDVYVSTVGGDVLVNSGFDIFSIGNGSIVAFDFFSIYGFHDCKFKQGSQIEHVELTEYENLHYVFNETPEKNFAFYIFTKSGEVPPQSLFRPDARYNNKEISASTFQRCDFGKYGGIPFEYGRKPYNIAKVFNPLNISGVGHIVRLEVLDNWYNDIDTHSKYTAAMTMSGIIKLIDDWSYVNNPPFNNQEEISKSAKKFMESLALPSGLLDEIRQSQPQSVLEYYLKGGADDLSGMSPENMSMTNGLKNFILGKCRYKSLNSMFNNHPKNPQIPEEILNKEINMYNSIIYRYCVLNNIDYNNLTVEILQEAFKVFKIDQNFEYEPQSALERLMFI